jgi:hypothetical protein
MSNDDSEPAIGRTLRAAYKVGREGSTVIIKPGELIDARYGAGVSPSLAARKVLALLIAKAGANAWKEGPFSITKKELRGSHNGNDRISGILIELMDLKFTMGTISKRGRDAVLTSTLMAWNIEERAEDGSSTVEFQFTEAARAMLQGSDYYARINRAALLAFKSKYSLLIYELGCLLVGRRDKSWKGSIEELRDRLTIPEHALRNFAQIRRSVLKVAQAEVNQLAHFEFSWRETTKGGRGGKIEEIDLIFTPKDTGAINEAAEELDRPKLGRDVRREGVVELIAGDNVLRLSTSELFPSSGPLKWSGNDKLNSIVLDCGGNWDRDIVAQAYRDHMGDRLTTLKGERLHRSFEGFCKTFVKNRGRPY